MYPQIPHMGTIRPTSPFPSKGNLSVPILGAVRPQKTGARDHRNERNEKRGGGTLRRGATPISWKFTPVKK
jgi:hypothetical protein